MSGAVPERAGDGYLVRQPLPGGACSLVHPDRPGRSWLAVPEPGPADFRQHAHIVPLLARIRLGSGSATLHPCEGARLLAEVPAPLPMRQLADLARAGLAILLSCGPVELRPELLLWRPRESWFGLVPRRPGGAPANELDLDRILLAWMGPADHARYRGRHVARAVVGDAHPDGPAERDLAAICSLGRVRAYNEDAYGWAPFPGGALLAIADGAGGFCGGEIASRLAIEAALDHTGGGPDHPLELFADASRRICARELEGSSSTLLVASVTGKTAWIAHVGDSRAYLFRDGALRQLTRDHTLVQKLQDEGRITAAEARTHPHAHILLSVLGPGDLRPPDIVRAHLRPGDRLLLCTDGLWRDVDDARIAAGLTRSRTARAAVADLHGAALAAGARDNLTVLVAQAQAAG